MHIAPLSAAQHAEFLALVNAEIRPDRAKTHAWDDFPLILGAENLPGMLGATAPDGTLAAGIAFLIREHETSCGRLAIAGVGSVVTHPRWRERGLSTALQNALLAELRRQDVPLAVLWTDKPEIYAGRGFVPAGWEWHVTLPAIAREAAPPTGFAWRPYAPDDAAAVAALYARHPWRTLRRPGDAARLYGMPGTRGLVAAGADGTAAAAAFCGKGADFPGYVTEWSGPVGLVASLLGVCRARGWADTALVPPGGEALAERLVAAGGAWCARPSGCWAVLDGPGLARRVAAAAGVPVDPAADARALLGGVDAAGRPQPGPLVVAVWGFDSV